MSRLNELISEASRVTSTITPISTPKRKYVDMKEVYFKDCPDFEINEEDSELFKLFKTIMRNNNFKYGDFLGKDRIVYSTFYNMKKTKRINFEMFQRFLNLVGLEIELIIKPQGENDGQ